MSSRNYSNIFKPLNKFFRSLGYKKKKDGDYYKLGDGVGYSVFIYPSTVDDSFYMASFVQAIVDGGPVDRSLEIGGRVSKAAVDFLDYSFDGSDDEIVSQSKFAFEKVISPWFSTYSSLSVLMTAFNEDDLKNIDPLVVERLNEIADDSTDANVSSLLYQPVSPKGFINLYDDVVKKLVSYGFEYYLLYDSICFYRKRNAVWDIFYFEICSEGVFCIIQVANWLPEIQTRDVKFDTGCPSDFEEPTLINGGVLSGGSIYPIPVSPICLADIANIPKTSKEIVDLLVGPGFSFLSTVNTKADYVDSVFKEYKLSSYFDKLLNEIKTLDPGSR